MIYYFLSSKEEEPETKNISKKLLTGMSECDIFKKSLTSDEVKIVL